MKQMSIYIKIKKFAAICVLAGCSRHNSPQKQNEQKQEVRIKSDGELRAAKGATVVLEGIAVDQKDKAVVDCGFYCFGINRMENWPPEFECKHVRVRGLLRASAPVPELPPSNDRNLAPPQKDWEPLDSKEGRYYITDATFEILKNN